MKYLVCCHGLDSLIGWDTQLGPLEFNTFIPMAEAMGYSCVTPSLGTDNVFNAAIIRATIDVLPSDAEVSIVAHSMGGLSSRHYLKYMGGAQRVNTYVAIDTPQFGTWDAVNVLKLLWEPQITPPAPFIKNLNANDQTPGDTLYVQLTVKYTDLMIGVRWKHLDGVTHKSVISDIPSLSLVLDTLNGSLQGLNVN